jgi:hypothetical protein
MHPVTSNCFFPFSIYLLNLFSLSLPSHLSELERKGLKTVTGYGLGFRDFFRKVPATREVSDGFAHISGAYRDLENERKGN